MNKNTVAPTRISLIIGDSERCYESPETAANPHSDLCSQLLKNPALKGWEKLFVTTLQKSPNPGRRQLEKLEAIAARLGYCVDEEGGEAHV